MSYVVAAHIPVKPEHLNNAVAAVRGILPMTRAEAGCEHFALHTLTDGSPTLYIYERWQNREAFDFHHAQEYTRAVYRSYENWLAGEVQITELTDAE